MVFRRRRTAITPITDRLRETFSAETYAKVGVFTAEELDSVQVFGRSGLVRLPQGSVDSVPPEQLEAIWRHLEAVGYLRRGEPRADEPARDQVPASIGPDREPVTLLGDFAIVVALRSSPSSVTELKCYRSHRLDQVIRMYTATLPAVILQEIPLDDGRLGFVLYRGDRGLVSLAGAVGVKGETLHAVTAPSPSRLPAAEARQRWDDWTEVSVARPNGTDVTVTSFTVGQDRDGLWTLEAPSETGTAVWTDPDSMGERLSALISPPPEAESWLPDHREP